MKRLSKVQAFLKAAQVEALLVHNPIDLFYLTGLTLSTGTLLITKEERTLFVDGRYKEVVAKSEIDSQEYTTLPQVLSKIGGSVGFDSNFVTYAAYQKLAKSKKELIPFFSPIMEIRKVKEEEEISKLRAAAKLCCEGMQAVVGFLQEGISEKEVAYKLEQFWADKKFSFSPIIAFGNNSSKPHHHSSERKLKRGDIVLVDIGVVLDHYHSDMTRCFGYGAVDERVKEIYAIVYEAKKRAIAGCRMGKELQAVDALARSFIDEKGYGEAFLHSLGHGIGLETHEMPYLRKTAKGLLEENEVVTIEPGIYLPNVGGVRIEDMIVVQNESTENLTPLFDSKELIII